MAGTPVGPPALASGRHCGRSTSSACGRRLWSEPPLPPAHRYVEAFFAPARLQDIEKQVPVVEPSFYDPLIRTTSSVFFTFTYDLGTAERFVHNSEQKLRRDKRGAAAQAQQCALCGVFETTSVAFSHCCANPATHTRACLKSLRLPRCLLPYPCVPSALPACSTVQRG